MQHSWTTFCKKKGAVTDNAGLTHWILESADFFLKTPFSRALLTDIASPKLEPKPQPKASGQNLKRGPYNGHKAHALAINPTERRLQCGSNSH